METASTPDSIHRNLMVNYLPRTWGDSELRQYFTQYGEIESSKVVVDRTTNASKGYGFVKFVNRNEAEAAMTALQGQEVEGRRLKIQKAELGRSPPGPASLYVAGFDPAYEVNEIQEAFQPYGSILKVYKHDSKTGKKGVAFVTMETWAEAQAAVAQLNGARLGADTITVRIADASARQIGGIGLQAPIRGLPNSDGVYQLPSQIAFQPLQAVPAVPTMAMTVPAVDPAAAGGVIPPPNGSNGQYCVFVFGIRGMNETLLHSLLSPFGTITAVNCPAGKGFGFVNMPNYYQALNAIHCLNGSIIPGNTTPLQVSFKT